MKTTTVTAAQTVIGHWLKSRIQGQKRTLDAGRWSPDGAAFRVNLFARASRSFGGTELHRIGRIFEILFNPGEAAATVHDHLWLPLVVLGATTAFANYPALFQLGRPKVLQMRLDATPDGMHPLSIVIFLFLMIFAPLLLPLGAWLAGVLMHFYLRDILGIRVSSRRVLCFTAYGLLPLGVEQLLIGALRLFCRAGDCNLFNPLAANLAFFLNAKTTPVFWYEFAKGADVFSFWAALVLCLGLADVAELETVGIVIPVVLVWVGIALVNAWLLA